MKKNRTLSAYSSFFVFFLGTTLLLSPFPAGAEAPPGPGNEFFQKAIAAVSQGAHDEAEEYFKKALDLEPMNPEYHFERANLYAQQHDESEGIGDELGADRKMQQAADDLEQSVMAKPEFLAAHFNLGVVYKKLGKYEDARKEFKEVLKLDPSQVSARMQIGAAYEDQGFYDEAEVIYKEVREQYPKSPGVADALNGLSQRRFQASQQERSERGMRMNALNSSLSSLSRGGDMVGSNTSSPSAGIGQAIPYLSQWALQQFMKGRKQQ